MPFYGPLSGTVFASAYDARWTGTDGTDNAGGAVYVLFGETW